MHEHPGFPGVTVMPPSLELERAVIDGGGRVIDIEEADAIVWTDPRHPEHLRDALRRSPARWVQLPFAGIERFIEAGVIDSDRIWTCTKGIYGPATGEHALGLILSAARLLHRHARRKSWIEHREIPNLKEGISEPKRLAGTTAVIVGTGGIGRWLAFALQILQVRVIGVNRSGTSLERALKTVHVGLLDTVVGEADWVVIAAPLTSETRNLIDARMLSLMRPDAWLINVARGGIADTDALVEALQSGVIAGAALDVTDPEPLPADHPLWRMENVLITSHTGNTASMALPDLCALVETNVKRFAAGEPLEGRIDPKLGY